MHEFLDYLNNPQLVADFQKVFGLEWEFDENSNKPAKSKTKTIDQNNNSCLSSNSTSSIAYEAAADSTVFKRGHAKTDSVVTDTDHSHIISKTIINNKFW